MYINAEARSRGTMTRASLDERPIVEVMTLCDEMIRVDQEMARMVEAMFSAMPR